MEPVQQIEDFFPKPLGEKIQFYEDNINKAYEKLEILDQKFQTLPDSGEFAFQKQALKDEANQTTEGIKQFLEAAKVLRDQAKDELANGKYKMNQGPEVRLDELSVKDQLKKHLSYALGTDVEKIDLDTGARAGDRFFAAKYSDPQKRLDFYQSTNMDKDVFAMEIDGKSAIFIRDPHGNIVKADDFDFSAKDLMPLAYETPKLLAAGAATVATGGGILAPAVVGGATYGLAGSGQDQAVEMGLVPNEADRIRYEDALAENMFYGATGVPVDILTMGAARPVARRVGKAVVSDAVQQTEKSLARLEKSGMIKKKDIRNLRPFYASEGDEGKRLIAMGQKNQESAIGTPIQRAREGIAAWKADVDSGKLADPSAYRNTVNKWVQQQDELVAKIGSVDSELAEAIRKDVVRKSQELQEGIPMSGTEELSTTIRNLIKDAESRAIGIERQSYKEFFDEANKRGLAIDPEDLANFMEGVYAKGGVKESGVVESTIKKLRQRKENAREASKLMEQAKTAKTPMQQDELFSRANLLRSRSGNLSYEEFRDIYKSVRDDVPAGMLKAPSGAQVQGREVARQMNEYASEKARAAGLGELWGKATRDLEERMKFNVGVLDSILATEAFDAAKLTPRQTINKVLSDPAYAQNVIGAASSIAPEAGADMRQTLQRAYLEKMNIGKETAGEFKQIDYDPEMIQKLWGVNRQGEVNEEFGKVVARNIDLLNRKIKASGIKPRHLEKADIDELAGVLSKDAAREAVDRINRRAQLRQRQQMINDNKLMKLATSAARQGDFSFIEADAFPRVFFEEAAEGRVNQILKGMGNAERSVLKNDVMTHFFQRYSLPDDVVAAGNTRYTPWDSVGFLEDLKKNPALQKNLGKVLGEDEAQKLVDMSRLANAVRPIKAESKSGVSPRFVSNQDQYSLYLAGDIPELARSAALAAKYRAGALMPEVRDILSRRVSLERFKKTEAKTNALLYTAPKAVESIFLTGRRHPAVIEWYVRNFGEGPLTPDELEDQVESQKKLREEGILKPSK